MGWNPFWRSMCCNFVPAFSQDFQKHYLLILIQLKENPYYKIGEISHEKYIGNKNTSSEIIST